MAIYLIHPLHGTHVVSTQNEVDICFENGWKLKEDKPKEEAPIHKYQPQRGRPKAK